MGKFVDVVVNNLAQIDQSSLVELKSSLSSDLQSGGVHNTEVSDVEAAILANNHELTFPELLIISYDIVVAVSLSNLVVSEVSRYSDLEVS